MSLPEAMNELPQPLADEDGAQRQTSQPELPSPSFPSLPTAVISPRQSWSATVTALDGKKLRQQQFPGADSGQWKKKKKKIRMLKKEELF